MKRNKLDVLSGDEYRKFITDYYGENSAAASLLNYGNTDWQEEIFHSAISSDHNITVQGGLKNMPYRISAGYTDQNGILKTSNFQRTTASVTLNPSLLNDHLKFNINGKFMYSHNRYANTGAIGEAIRFDPTQHVTSSWPAYKDFRGYFQWGGDGSAYNDYTVDRAIIATGPGKNPVAMINERNQRANSYDYMGNVEVDYQIHGFEDLRLHANASGDWANGKEETDLAPWGSSSYYYGNSGYSFEKKYNLTFSAYAQYYKDFLKTQHFDIMVGYEWSHNKYWGDSAYESLYPQTYGTSLVDGKVVDDPTLAALRGTAFSSSKSEWKQESYLVSFFGRANYIAFDRYMVTATVRRDGSSRFKEHWATFPSVALGWKINDEFFLKDVKWMNELKLRLGWGKTGQQDGIGNYNYFATYNVNTNSTNGRYPIVGVNDDGILYRPDAYNPELKWETTTTWNAGLDFSFFHNRISGSVDYYYRKTTDLINTATVSAGSNFRNQVVSNIGSLENRGVEAALTVRPVQTEDVQWEVTANFTYNKNKITELTGDGDIIMTGGISAGTGNQIQAHAVGYPHHSFYVFQQVYDENGIPLEGVYVDRNADGVINDADRYFYKSPSAPYTAGLSSRIQVKNWDLGFGLRASFDNYVYWDCGAGFSNIATRYDASFNYLQNVIPQAVINGWTTYDYVKTDYFVRNGSFLKCDNITLGYSFEDLFKGGNYNGLSGRIYLAATNVFTITKYDGLDPEVYGGIDNNIYPRPFTIQCGLNLNF